MKSVGALSAARALALASQVLVLPILARYLSPTEFGLAALAMSVAVFANMLSDGGMGRSLIRTPLSASDEWSSVFWFLGALGAGLTIFVLALTPAMVWLFDEPELFGPLAALGAMPLILSLNAPFAAEMEQREVFGELALSQTVATFAALGVAVYLAVAGYGVWALIAQQIVLNMIVATWSFIRSKFRPRVMFSRTALGPHFSFGRDTAAASMIGYLREQSTPLVIGKVLGTAELGIFAMAARFLRLPMFGLAGPASRVIYVRLTQAREDPERFLSIILAATRLLSFAILPAMTAVAIISDTAFTLLLSETWTNVAPVFALAAGGAALTATTVPAVGALTALGLTAKRLRLTAEITVVWLILLSATVTFGLIALAAARTVWMVVMLPRHWFFLRQSCGMTATRYLNSMIPGALTSVAIGAALLVTEAAFDFGPLSSLAVSAAVCLAVAAAATALAFGSLKSDLRALGH